MRTFKEFLDICGSAQKIAIDFKMHQVSIEAWNSQKGIPEKYWKRLIETYPGLSAQKLHELNNHIREKNACL